MDNRFWEPSNLSAVWKSKGNAAWMKRDYCGKFRVRGQNNQIQIKVTKRAGVT